MHVAIDSNALTYLIDAMEPNYDPLVDTTSNAAERTSMLRIFLYAGIGFYLTPQVVREYQQIPSFEWKDLHRTTSGALLNEIEMDLTFQNMHERKKELLSYHSKNKDCQILTEAEFSGMSFLLTRDNNFIKRLSGVTSLSLLYPSRFWEDLNFKPGSKPIYMPANSNPLIGKSWWKL